MRYFSVSMNCINFRPLTSLIDLIYASIQTHANSIGVSSREPSNPQWSEDHYSVTDQAKTWLNGAFVIAIWFVSQGLGQVVSLDYAANRLLQFFVLMPELFTSSRVLKSLWLTSNKFHPRRLVRMKMLAPSYGCRLDGPMVRLWMWKFTSVFIDFMPLATQ